jgi:hypothetical protein
MRPVRPKPNLAALQSPSRIVLTPDQLQLSMEAAVEQFQLDPDAQRGQATPTQSRLSGICGSSKVSGQLSRHRYFDLYTARRSISVKLLRCLRVQPGTAMRCRDFCGRTRASRCTW